MSFRVTAPLVVVREHGATRYAALGELVDGLSEADAARLVKRGFIAPTGESVSAPAAVVDVPTEVAPAATPAASGGRPKRTHGLDKWQAYARSQGLSDEDIAGASKAELIAALS